MSDFLKQALANAGLAMEDAEVVAGGESPIEDTPIEEVIESSDVEADPVEEGVDEIEEAAEETEEAVDQIETSEEVVEALESIYASMESAMADGGLTAREAGFANAAIAAQLKRLRVASPIKMSTESFVSPEDRKANTELSMEGLKEVGKKVVDAIRAALKAVREAAKNFWIKITDTGGRLQKRAQEMIKALDAKEGDIKNAKVIEHKAIATIQWLSGGVKRADWPKQALSIVKATHAVLNWSKTVRSGLEAMAEGKLPNLPELAESAFADLPCGAKLVKAGADTFSYKLEVTKTREGVSEEFEIPNKAALKVLLSQVAEAAGQLSQFRKDWQQTEAAIEGALKKLESKAGDKPNEIQKEIQSKFQKAARAALSLPQTWGSFAFRCMNAYLSIAGNLVKHWDNYTKQDGKLPHGTK